MLAGRIGGLRCGGPLFDWQRLRVEMPVISYHAPSRGREMPEGQWVARRRKSVKPTSGAARHLLPEEGGRMPPFLHRHFERKREIFFVRGQAKVVREAGNGKHRMLHVTGDHGASCRWIYEGKQQTANEKDPSAALGMTKRGNASRPFLFNPERSQPPALRATSFQRKEGECRLSCIVISSGSEKSFSFAVRQKL